MRWVVLACLWAGVEGVIFTQPAPLPDQATFFAQLRARIGGARLREGNLAYTETAPELRFNPVGTMGAGAIVVTEVYPFPELDLIYRRIVERAGLRVPSAELATQDRRFLARLAEARAERGARERRTAAARAEEAAVQRDVFDAQVFVIEDRVDYEGQSAIQIRFSPRPDAKPRTREGRLAAAFAGQVWIHEADLEVMRVVGDAVGDVSFGLGVIGRLYRGSHVESRRRKIGDDWVTTDTVFRGTARALFRRIELDFRREYTNYRRFNPEQFETVLAGK